MAFLFVCSRNARDSGWKNCSVRMLFCAHLSAHTGKFDGTLTHTHTQPFSQSMNTCCENDHAMIL